MTSLHKAFICVLWSFVINVALAKSIHASGQQHQHVFLPNTPLVPKEDAFVPRVGIIGAGPGGTSAAYFLSFLANRNESMKTDVTVYESSHHIGGRVEKIAVPDSENKDEGEGGGPFEVELGASIFVDANLNIVKAARVFNLTVQDGFGDEERSKTYNSTLDRVVIWDGEKFVFSSSNSDGIFLGWWDKIKMIWRYGILSTFRARNAVSSYVKQFVKLYTSPVQLIGPFNTPVSFAHSLNISSADWNVSAAQYFIQDEKISPLFVNEIVSAATRVNYGQNPSSIHTFAGFISMAGSGVGTKSIAGGNQQLYEKFLNSSGANVKLGTIVTGIEKISVDGKDKWSVRSSKKDNRQAEKEDVFDRVIVATPLSLSGINTAAKIPSVEYVKLHVTILTTTAAGPRASFFLKEEQDKDDDEMINLAPRTIYSTFEYRNSVDRPKLNALNYIHFIEPDRWVVKIFSEEEMDDEKLSEIFGDDQVVWVYRKVWNAYPKLKPLDEEGKGFAPFELDSDGLYYINAFESLASTMETETVSAWNAVQLLTKNLWGYRSECSWAEIEE